MIKSLNVPELKSQIDLEKVGREMYQLISDLYPICRSITGNGFRETLNIIKEYIPIEIHEVESGTKVFDWTVPKEWNIRDAYIKAPDGKKIVDFQQSNLHVVNYSIPVKKRMSLAELQPHLHTLPEHPEWVPYRTAYYDEIWGFCMRHDQYLALKEGQYEVVIESSLEPGHLTYGEFYLQGESGDEVLISCHCCHPSMCNDNLSGMAISTFLAKKMSALRLKYSYRFLFVPGMIGSITWLSVNEDKVSNIKHGLIAACLGDPGNSTYKKSRRGNAEIDRTVQHVLKHSGSDYKVVDFFPYGYDERQYCSPGFNLPVGCLMRTSHGEFPEYHTSADNLDFVHPQYLSDSFSKFIAIFNLLENNGKYVNLSPKCEPQLGKRGLYNAIDGTSHSRINQMAMLWVLNLCDGEHTLLDIAEKANLSFETVAQVASILQEHKLLESVA